MMVSVDGYFEGPNHDLSWHNVDHEFNAFVVSQTQTVGTLLFGHRTYDLMKDYWPTEQARKGDPLVAKLMNNTPKIVFSKTLDKVEETEHWKNVRLMKEINAEEINQLKTESSQPLAIFGSNQLCVSLMKLGLVDEFRIMVNPVAIGQGTPLFYGLENKFKLNLVDTQTFKNGNVLLRYEKQ